jgi:hypothetical protein
MGWRTVDWIYVYRDKRKLMDFRAKKFEEFLEQRKTVSFSKLPLLHRFIYLFSSSVYNVSTALYHTIYRFVHIGPNWQQRITHFLTMVASSWHVLSVLRVVSVYRSSVSAGRKTVHCSVSFCSVDDTTTRSRRLYKPATHECVAGKCNCQRKIGSLFLQVTWYMIQWENQAILCTDRFKVK